MKHRYAVRIMPADDALAFIQNMRWFAGYGKIRATKLPDGNYSVKASVSAWSNWAGK